MAKKYIDAEKLIAEIERLWDEYDCKELSERNEGAIEAIDQIESFITPLQQEQESVAEQFAKIVRANLSEIGNNAQSQFEQLYFEITGTKMYGGYND